MRILYLHPGLMPPPHRESHDRFHFLSETCAGDVLLPVWWRKESEALEQLGAYPVFRRGRFSYHFHLDRRWPPPLDTIGRIRFYLRRALWLHRHVGPYDVVMPYGTNSTGIAAVAISRITGARLIPEIQGVPQDAFLFESQHPSRSARLKHSVADRLLRFVLHRANHVKLLYPTQLGSYPTLRGVPSSAFHDFVPVQELAPAVVDDKYVLFVGHPWYLKGVDVLIQAFVTIAAQVPDYRLKLIGHFPDRSTLERLAGPCPRIEILPPVPHAQALAAIGSCSVFVLPSRSEGMGRVLIEAMAAARPIVATRVGGIPHYIRDGDNGFLVDPGSVPELAARILDLLRQPELARKLGRRGREIATSEYDERAFVRRFSRMLIDSAQPRQSSSEAPRFLAGP